MDVHLWEGEGVEGVGPCAWSATIGYWADLAWDIPTYWARTGPCITPVPPPFPPCGSAETRESPETSSQCVRNMSVSESES